MAKSKARRKAQLDYRIKKAKHKKKMHGNKYTKALGGDSA